MFILIVLVLANLYCLACLLESLFGSADKEPKWNVFHTLNRLLSADWYDDVD